MATRGFFSQVIHVIIPKACKNGRDRCAARSQKYIINCDVINQWQIMTNGAQGCPLSSN